MKWCSSLSEERDLVHAVREASASVRASLGGDDPNLLLLFVSEEYAESAREAAALVGGEFGSSFVLGCTARSVIGNGREVEEGPALSLTAAVLPEVSLHPFHLDVEALPDIDADPAVWREQLGLPEASEPQFLLLSDPYSFDVERLTQGLDAAFPTSPKVGGVASAGQTPGDNSLYLGGHVYSSGLVGVALTGRVRIDTIVAQGCRPIGSPMFVTAARDNVLLALDGRPPIEVLQELYQELSPEDQKLCRGSLFLGVEMKEAQAEYAQGDFLVRNLLGSDRDSGALHVGAILRDRQVVQFHLRDARTSSEDLARRLDAYRASAGDGAAAAILFSCLGRGVHLYGEENHDSRSCREVLGELPIAGFFCNGEIGPVGGTTFLHGYTSAFGIVRPT